MIPAIKNLTSESSQYIAAGLPPDAVPNSLSQVRVPKSCYSARHCRKAHEMERCMNWTAIITTLRHLARLENAFPLPLRNNNRNSTHGADLGAVREHGGDGAAQDAEEQEQRQLVQRPQLVLGHTEGGRRAEARL